MEFDLPSLNKKDRYKLLTSTIIPRPIALVSTVDEDGTLNCAPYSFFNAFSEDPPVCVLGIQRRPDLKPKDTSRLIRDGGEFVVNLVDMRIAEGMNISAVRSFPHDPRAVRRKPEDRSKGSPRKRQTRATFGCCTTMPVHDCRIGFGIPYLVGALFVDLHWKGNWDSGHTKKDS